MFREMRRKNQLLSPAECESILLEGTSGVLALAGDCGYPYAVPLSYVLCKNKIYFHCAPVGHKADAVARCGKASFCVIGSDCVAPEKFTTLYRSVIVFGAVSFVTGIDEKRLALEAIAQKYSPNEGEAARKKEIEQSLGRVSIISLEIEYITGKQAKELI